MATLDTYINNNVMNTWLSEDVTRMLIAMVVGAVIGTEREYRSKSAGLRTTILVCMGACLFTLLSIRIGTGSPDRIASNIVTGIGFLGAGVIFKDDNKVTGITTATTIWMVAALGMAIGAGHYTAALVGTLVVLFVLVLLVYMQNVIEQFNQLRNYKIVTEYQQETLERYELLFREYKLRAVRGRQSKKEGQITGNWIVQGAKINHERLVQRLLQDKDILEFDF